MKKNTAQRLLQEEGAVATNTESTQATAPIMRNMSKILKLDMIERNPDNREINMDKVHELMESIENIGLLHDPAVRTLNNGKYMLISGGHRYEAYVQLSKTDDKYQYIRCKVVDNDDLHTELAMIDGNLKSNGLSPYEEVMAVGRREEILRTIGKTGTLRDVIAKELGQGATQVGKKLKIYKKASNEVLAAFRDGSITFEKAAALSSLSHEEQQRKLNNINTTKSKELPAEDQVKKKLITLLKKTFKDLDRISTFYYDYEECQSNELKILANEALRFNRSIRSYLSLIDN